jgi:hypothetical protein
MSDERENYSFLHVEPLSLRAAVKRRTSDELLAEQVYQLANDRLRHVNATKRLSDEMKRLWERLQVHEPPEPPRPPSRHGKPTEMSDG